MKDIEYVPMPEDAPEYLKGLPLHTYSGPWKVALLRVLDETQRVIKVADWTLYGPDLRGLVADRPDISVQPYLSELYRAPGFPNYYSPLYLPAGRKIWYRPTVKQP